MFVKSLFVTVLGSMFASIPFGSPFHRTLDCGDCTAEVVGAQPVQGQYVLDDGSVLKVAWNLPLNIQMVVFSFSE